MPKLLFTVTVPETAVAFLRGQLSYLQQHNFTVTVVTSPGPQLDEFAQSEHIKVISLPMAREINVVSDLQSLPSMVRIIRTERPEIVNASTPKAGLLGMIAARLCNVPHRVYQLRGLRLETVTGFKRLLLMSTERLASANAQWVICNSPSLKNNYAELGLAPATKLRVLGAGSSNGVIAERFLPSPNLLTQAEQLRTQFGFQKGQKVIGYVGRLTRDKGIVELIDAFDKLYSDNPSIHLLLVGTLESGDAIPSTTLTKISSNPAIHMSGFVKEPAAYYYLMDILAFPSYREGFPNVPLEAAIAGLPIVGFRSTGVVDAVRDGETGLLTPVGDTHALYLALKRMLEDDDLRLQFGRAGKQWVLTNFRAEKVWQMWADFYLGLLNLRTNSSN